MVDNQPPSNLQQPSDLQPSSHPRHAQPRLNPLLRRRRRLTRQAKMRDHATLEATLARLVQINARSAKATMAQVQAIEDLIATIDGMVTATSQAADRLAAAIGKFRESNRLNVVPPSKKKCHRLESSKSGSE